MVEGGRRPISSVQVAASPAEPTGRRIAGDATADALARPGPCASVAASGPPITSVDGGTDSFGCDPRSCPQVDEPGARRGGRQRRGGGESRWLWARKRRLPAGSSATDGLRPPVASVRRGTDATGCALRSCPQVGELSTASRALCGCRVVHRRGRSGAGCRWSPVAWFEGAGGQTLTPVLPPLALRGVGGGCSARTCPPPRRVRRPLGRRRPLFGPGPSPGGRSRR